MTKIEEPLRQNKTHSERWIGLLGAAGFFTFLGSVIGQGLEGHTALTLERLKYEYSLISDILSNKDISNEDATEQLRFLTEIGAVKVLDTESLDKNAESLEKLRTLPAQSSISPITVTRLAFETPSYGVRVFESGNRLAMNAFNKLINGQELNGAAATFVPAEEPYEQAVSYVAYGEKNGIPVQYFVRINSMGMGILEIYSTQDQRLFQEQASGDVISNLPNSDLPTSFKAIPP
ncbi:hypothetical protein XM38_018530 [Halomicronema hongdechloris C2206]|uniref:Uncharacterized protein n=1 Tax=Halomicronema hongdechloris C2206 TaxID=1641165 RepID=A0A1Z3HKT8_9CYAN|nr:hypothetical protein [Halomicronema hongdechloris]ASC70905.1 hypothetical protein XM38_018530 [Halomicronema hongdechloris C2206]